MASESSKKEKEIFFAKLSSLDQDDSEDGLDEGLRASLDFMESHRQRRTRAKSKASGSHSHIHSTNHERENLYNANSPKAPAVTRSFSAPEPIQGKQDWTKEHPIPETPLTTRPQANLKHTVSLSALLTSKITMAPPAISRSKGKKKQASALKLVPEEQRIFRDFNFYFFPNNDVHPARRMKITKALEYGAKWVKDWAKEGITHVIMDKNLDFKQLIDYLKLDSLPPDTIVVNEAYPSDCIAFRTILDHQQRQYKVSGQEVPTSEEGAPVTTPPLPVPSHAEPSQGLQLVRQLQTARSASKSGVEHSPTFLSSAGETESGSHAGNDDLDQAIRDVKGLENMPLDLEEDSEGGEAGQNMNADSGDESFEERVKKKPKLAKSNTWQDDFQCMHKNEAGNNAENPNARTIEVLEQMRKYYEQVHDQWRPVAYRRAIASLRKQRHKIVTKEDAFSLPFVGERLAAKIEEIVWTNKLRRLDNARLDGSDETLQRFLKIYGVGFSQASKWVDKGYKTLQELLDRVELTDNQKIGIEHYDDFQARVPRAEVCQHGGIVRKAIQSIDPEFEVVVGGSYRRGAIDSGDIDLIITKPNAPKSYIRTIVLDTLVPRLFSEGFLTAGLAVTNRDDGSKWHGASVLPGSTTWRRIDLLLVPEEELGAALIYFTGNDIFNRSIRLLASKKGMRLNQRGLYKDAMRGKGRQRITQGTLMEGRDERRIFEILGVPWREPHQRIC